MQSKRLTALFVTGYPPACGGGGIPLAIYSQLALMAGVAHHRRTHIDSCRLRAATVLLTVLENMNFRCIANDDAGPPVRSSATTAGIGPLLFLRFSLYGLSKTYTGTAPVLINELDAGSLQSSANSELIGNS